MDSKTRLIATPLVAVLAAGLIAVGCGGDDETTTTTSFSTPSATATGPSGASGPSGDLASQVNQICREVDEDAVGVVAGLDTSTPQAQREYVDAVAPIIQAALDQMSALPGVEDDAQITAFIEASQDALDRLELDPTLIEDPSLEREVDRAATEAGLKDCD